MVNQIDLINMKLLCQQCSIKQEQNYLFLYLVCADKRQRHLATKKKYM